VLSIIALIAAFVVPLAGIIVGAIALGQIKKTGESGHGLALAGLVLGAGLLSGGPPTEPPPDSSHRAVCSAGAHPREPARVCGRGPFRSESLDVKPARV